jgi:hypothetical protein
MHKTPNHMAAKQVQQKNGQKLEAGAQQQLPVGTKTGGD